ncbi:hypothetical protein FGE12_14520 [Aggregicoccus sp. 17bor-14]|uniref:hypothetical protein n=1 Tax=Myxococcaceae TaxID=31 RepID=UPI00129CF93E|nr:MULTISPECIES: hypothetical protein [Myxococcaceae]MBF5043608.1 hypothetical protein [Simulacricoccus sp. 17bor-14]MRI89367.1 hypothetical protein [Aggregicoccus sp. 17bor-14]
MVLALAGAVAVAGCGGSEGANVEPDERPVVVPDSGTPDASVPDAGQPDAGRPDSGTPDSGTPDSGIPDAGPQPLPAEAYPTLEGWRFVGPEAGGPSEMLDVATDGSGNLWVAGGEDGLFLLRKTASGYAERFERFTMADGLRPYGYMPDGSAPPGTKYLKVISVEGGPGSATVFVGYQGKPPPAGAYDCENNWDGPNPDPSIYKSGDADRVTLTSSGLQVVHYDIFSGPGVVAREPQGRERICNIYRLAYDPATDTIWFGANHGFARGDGHYPGNPTCNGQMSCWGGEEHTHPAIAGCSDSDHNGNCNGESPGPVTDRYFGIAPTGNGDVWFGGANRSVKFLYGSRNRNYWKAASETEDFPYAANRLDIWPDPFYEVQPNGEPTYYTPKMRDDDNVSAMALTPDGGAYVSSFNHGLRVLNASGNLAGDLTDKLLNPYLTAMAYDSSGDTLWVGYWWGGGISRMSGNGSGATHLFQSLGALGGHPVYRLRVDRTGGGRRVLAAFGALQDKSGGKAGALGIYTGP